MAVRSHVFSYLLVIVMLTMTSATPHRGIKRIWATDDSEKIKKEDIANPLASDQNNVVWSHKKINLFGAKNEIVAFQLIIEAGDAGARGVNVSISDLRNGKAVIPGSATGRTDPYDYRNRYVELFTEHYLNITKRTPPLWFFSENAQPSDYYSGWIPDCLIPFSAPEGKGGAPFTIEAKMNQGVWADIYIPENAVPGIYEGKAIVTGDGRVNRKIPVILKVYDFKIPDSVHLGNMFGYYTSMVAKRHNVNPGSDEFDKIELKYNQLAHRHRFDLVSYVRNINDMNRFYKKYLTGEAYSDANGYAGPGKNTANTTFSIGFGGGLPEEYGGKPGEMNEQDWQKGSDIWENWFRDNAPGIRRHKYLFPDEPDFKGPAGKKGTGSMDTIKLQADWTHRNPGPGKNIPVLVTNTIKPVIAGYVDFWSISAQEWNDTLTREAVDAERARGHKFGIYNGFRPGIGAVVIDADAVDFRVMPWVAWLHHIDQYFYWSTTFWTDINLFISPLTYEHRVNGDGTFLYPGTDAMFPEESRKLDGPLSSIRAKNWRRGEQDYEYLWIARKLGFGEEADIIARNCVPTSVWEAKDQQDVTWSSHGYNFDKYRRKLAELITGNR